MNIERIRAALAAGPTPGPWSLETDSGFNYRDINYGVGAPAPYYWVVPTLDIPKEDAAFIAACYPEAIRELLAERDALLDALQHMRHCGWCAADDWQNCEGGRAALAAIDAAKERA